MANCPSAALVLRDGDRERLVSLTRSTAVRAGLALRAPVVLLAAEGVATTAIAEQVGLSRPKVIGWRQRYERGGLKGLDDADRTGQPRRIDHAMIVAETLQPRPRRLGVTYW